MPKVDGVFVDSYNYAEMTAQTYRFASFSEYPEYFPNFAQGIFSSSRSDGRSLITFDGEATLQSGALGANIKILGEDVGFVAKALNKDIIGVRPSVNFGKDWRFSTWGYTDLMLDDELEFAIEGGTGPGFGIMKRFDANTGTFKPGTQLKYIAGAAPVEIEYETGTKDISLKFGGSAEVYLGAGFKIEANIQINPPPKVNFSEYETKLLEQKN